MKGEEQQAPAESEGAQSEKPSSALRKLRVKQAQAPQSALSAKGTKTLRAQNLEGSRPAELGFLKCLEIKG